MIVGIDPGISGAIAFQGWNILQVEDMPVSARTYGKGNQVNAALFNDLLNKIIQKELIIMVFIERVSAMPPHNKKGQRVGGATSMFTFGEGFGVIKGVLAGRGIPTTYVTPVEWKRHFKLLHKEKDVARTVATELFPSYAPRLARKKDVGRADALLIMTYGVTHDALRPKLEEVLQ